METISSFHFEGPVAENTESRAMFTALSFLRYSGIAPYLGPRLAQAAKSREELDIHTQEAAKVAFDEFTIVAPVWNLLHNIKPDFDANYIDVGRDTQVILTERVAEIRRKWWSEGDKQTRLSVDDQFTTFFHFQMRPIVPGTLEQGHASLDAFRHYNELWRVMASEDVTNAITIAANQTGETFENLWLGYAKTSLIFSLMAVEKQKETDGLFLPDSTLLQLAPPQAE